MPQITVNIRDGGTVPTLGQSVTLTCDIIGADKLNSIITYTWTKNNDTHSEVIATSNTLSFPTLHFSSTGEYTCNVSVESPHLIDVINIASSSYNIIIECKSVYYLSISISA